MLPLDNVLFGPVARPKPRIYSLVHFHVGANHSPPVYSPGSVLPATVAHYKGGLDQRRAVILYRYRVVLCPSVLAVRSRARLVPARLCRVLGSGRGIRSMPDGLPPGHDNRTAPKSYVFYP